MLDVVFKKGGFLEWLVLTNEVGWHLPQLMFAYSVPYLSIDFGSWRAGNKEYTSYLIISYKYLKPEPSYFLSMF